MKIKVDEKLTICSVGIARYGKFVDIKNITLEVYNEMMQKLAGDYQTKNRKLMIVL